LVVTSRARIVFRHAEQGMESTATVRIAVTVNGRYPIDRNRITTLPKIMNPANGVTDAKHAQLVRVVWAHG